MASVESIHLFGIRKLSFADIILDPNCPQKITLESLYDKCWCNKYTPRKYGSSYSPYGIYNRDAVNEIFRDDPNNAIQILNQVIAITSDANSKHAELKQILHDNPFQPPPLMHENFGSVIEKVEPATCLPDCCLDNFGIDSRLTSTFIDKFFCLTIGFMTPFACFFQAIFVCVGYILFTLLDCLLCSGFCLLGMKHMNYKTSEDERRWFNAIITEKQHLCSFQIDNTVKVINHQLY